MHHMQVSISCGLVQLCWPAVRATLMLMFDTESGASSVMKQSLHACNVQAPDEPVMVTHLPGHCYLRFPETRPSGEAFITSANELRLNSNARKASAQTGPSGTASYFGPVTLGKSSDMPPRLWAHFTKVSSWILVPRL